jgi:hypothetical protein
LVLIVTRLHDYNISRHAADLDVCLFSPYAYGNANLNPRCDGENPNAA